MKKAIRVILSPFIFISIFSALFIIGIPIFTFIGGFMGVIYNYLMDDFHLMKYNKEVMFMSITLPYQETVKFIKGKN